MYDDIHMAREQVSLHRAMAGVTWRYYLVRGLLAGVLGLCALIWPTISLSILLALVGIYCLVDGATGLTAAIAASAGGGQMLQAVFGLVVGAVLLFWPGATIKVLLVVFGAWMLFSGVSQVLLARRMMIFQPERGWFTGIGAVATVFGVILIFWPGTGVVAIAWAVGAAALLIAALLISVAIRFKRLSELPRR